MLKRASSAKTKVETISSHAPQRAALARQERQESDAEIANYIAEMATEMGKMAAGARMDLLAYFLSLARLEAETIARRPLLDEIGG